MRNFELNVNLRLSRYGKHIVLEDQLQQIVFRQKTGAKVKECPNLSLPPKLVVVFALLMTAHKAKLLNKTQRQILNSSSEDVQPGCRV